MFEGVWEVSKEEVDSMPLEIRKGKFPDYDYKTMGLDGISADFNIETHIMTLEKHIWCPFHDLYPEYEALLHWCWEGLYKHSPPSYRVWLEQVYTYFPGWNAGKDNGQ